MLNFEIRKKYFSFLVKKISDVYEIITGIPPLSLPNSKGKNLKSYSISGNVDEEIIEYSDGTAIEGKPNLLRTLGRTEQAITGSGASVKRILQGDKWAKLMANNNPSYPSNVVVGEGTVSFNALTTDYGVSFPVRLKPNHSYTVYANVSVTNSTSKMIVRIAFYAADGTWLSQTAGNYLNSGMTLKSFTVPANAEMTSISFVRYGDESGIDTPTLTFSDIMLVEGVYTTSNAPAYTPYKQLLTDCNGVGDYDSTTNKYKIPVLSSGTNLVPYPYITSPGTIQSVIWTVGNDGHISATGTSTGGLNFILFNINSNFRLIKGTYTICVKGKHQGVILYYRNESVSPTQQVYIASSENDACVTFTIGNDIENNHRMYFNVPAANTTVDVDCTVMLVAGEYFVSTMPDYQKYVAGTSNNIFINNSLYKTGENFDKINYPQNKTVKAVGKYVFTGNENIELYDNSKGFRFAVSDMETGNCIDGYCNRFENFKNSADNDVPKVFFGYNNNYVYFRRFSATATTAEAIKATLADWYSNGKPLTIWYPLEDEVEETVTLPDIPTIRENTTIMIDTSVQPSEMSVEYAVEEA